MRCLHCEIAELMLARQAQGETVSGEMIGRICEVIADIAASQPTRETQGYIFFTAAQMLLRLNNEVASGAYAQNAVIHDPNGNRQPRH